MLVEWNFSPIYDTKLTKIEIHIIFDESSESVVFQSSLSLRDKGCN